MPAPQIQQIATEYKPWGLTAGAMVGQQQYDTEAANLQALNEARLANVGHQKDAMLAQGQMDNPAWLQAKIAGEIGQGQSLAAGGEYDKVMLSSKLKEGIAKGLAGASEQQVKQQLAEGTQSLNAMKLAITYLDGPNGQNPAAITGVLQKYGTAIGFPPEMHQQLLQAEQQKPGTIKQAVSALIPQLQEAISITPQVYAEMAKNKAKIQDEETITHSKDRAARLEAIKYEANMRLQAAREKIKADNTNEEKSRTLDQTAGYLLKKAAETTDPVEQKAWMDSYNIAIDTIKQIKGEATRVKTTADDAMQDKFINRGKPGTSGKPLGDGIITTPSGNKARLVE